MARAGGQRCQPTRNSPPKASAGRGREEALRLLAEEKVKARWSACQESMFPIAINDRNSRSMTEGLQSCISLQHVSRKEWGTQSQREFYFPYHLPSPPQIQVGLSFSFPSSPPILLTQVRNLMDHRGTDTACVCMVHESSSSFHS